MSDRRTFRLHLGAVIFAISVMTMPWVGAQFVAPPDIALTPTSLSLQLRQGETASRSFTIQNKGKGLLTWTASLGGAPSWAMLAVEAGTVQPKTSQTVKITLEAGQLETGTYTSSFSVSSDDPDTPEVERAITLKVVAAPVAVFEPAALEFESTFVKGHARKTVTVTNRGGAMLSINSTLPLSLPFVCVEKLPIKVAPGFSRDIEIEFRPTAEGEFSGNVVLLDNTARRYSYLPAFGAALYGPVVKVTPGSAASTLNPGVLTEQILNLSNATKGRVPLEWQAKIEGQQASWISLETTSGSLAAGDDPAQIVVKIDTSGVEPGAHAIKLLIQSNDPVRPEVRLPLTIRVNKAAALSATPGNLDFPNASVGHAENFGLTVTNTGNVTMVVSNVISTGQEIVHGFVEQKTLLRGESWNLPARFTPAQTGAFNGALTIHTTDKKVSSVIVPITASVVRPASIAVDPGSLTVNLAMGETVTRDLTVTNSGEAALSWNAVLQNVTPGVSSQSSLTEVLQRLDSQPSSITSVISNLFYFTGGNAGISIVNGGSDMYNTGNKIGTNLAVSMPYSDGVIAPHVGVGTNGAYFTRKHPGLFVFAADLVGISRFSISGNLGANGTGTAAGAVLTRTVAGITYKGFFKRVYGAGVPSVNHLLITANSANVAHAFNSDTNSDRHDLDGLYSASTRVYYLLFATPNGGFVNDAAAADVMRRFLETCVHPATTGWVRIDHASGTTNGGTSSTETVTFDASSLSIGTYAANLRFTSNAVTSSTVNVPMTVNVTASNVEAASAAVLPSEISETTVSLPAFFDSSDDGSRLRVTSNAGQLSANLVSSLATYWLSSSLAVSRENDSAQVFLSATNPGLTVDLNGDGIADVSSFASNRTLPGSEPGSVIHILSYQQRTGVAGTALVLETSQDGGENWISLKPNLDYTLERTPLQASGSETVELHISAKADTEWRFRLVGAGNDG